MNEELRLAYLAGFLDGEGSIGLSKRLGSEGKVFRVPRYVLLVRAGNTHLSPLEALQNTFGGTVRLRYFNGTRKDLYGWTCTGERGFRVLKKLSPYLKVKSEQARLGMEFWKEYVSQRSRGSAQVDVKDMEERERYYLAFKDLNRRHQGSR